MSYRLLRPLLFLTEPEQAHGWALAALRRVDRLGSGRLHQAGALAPLLSNLRGGASDLPPEAPVELLGLRFPNRVGLAAGFDKDATCVDGIGALGFGFIEVGTVTPRPQAGQPKPRVFRIPSAEALVNRMGFPNEGAARVAERLMRRQYQGIVGVNIARTPIRCSSARSMTTSAASRPCTPSPTTSPSTSPRRTPSACATCRRPSASRRS